ncbi:retrotransposon-related protein [Tanacetum coccineum]
MEGKRKDKEVGISSNAELLMLCVFPNTLLNLMNLETKSTKLPKEMKEVVDEYEDVFEVPKQLPSHRSHDHRIPLIEGTQPVNIRPYRHPPTQKEAIEAMVKELLEVRVIKPSNSPFASPIVMVKKKDDTRRMCNDYRQLNKCTMKDKFPIPIIKELIDELCGAIVFSKLDLRSRYHQIRMYEEDVAKTAFKTHEGHYEFLVIPFGLTNALSTFQALMNEVFKKFLRKFTLAFFDDILVYNKTIKEYVIHLRMVLDAMRSNKLYAKQTKCVFGTSHVEYLGHIILAQGVAIDPNKVLAMRKWPVLNNTNRPLTQLLKKNAFLWNAEAQSSFGALKQAMMRAPVLAMMRAPVLGLPNFNEPFMVETDASVTTELMQKVKDSWVEDATLNSILTALQNGLPTKNTTHWLMNSYRRRIS